MPTSSRDELNISASTAELLAAVDAQDDGDVIAQALEQAIIVLVDITGKDPLRPAVNSSEKIAARALTRILETLEGREKVRQT